MASGKLTPRQKMINMMYLVLTALLALNVSHEILKAFRLLSESIQKTSARFNEKNAATTADIRGAIERSFPDKKYLLPYIDSITTRSDIMVKYLTGHVDALFSAEVGGTKKRENGPDGKPLPGPRELEGDGDKTTPNFVYWMKGKGGNAQADGGRGQGEARNLKDQLNSFVTWSNGMVKRIHTVGGQLNTKKKLREFSPLAVDAKDDPSITDANYKQGPKSTWEYYNFNQGVPVAASEVLLQKFINDILVMEGDLLEECRSALADIPFRIDSLILVDAPNALVVPEGFTFESKISVSSIMAGQGNTPEWGGGLTPDAGGNTATYKVKASLSGGRASEEKTYSASARIKKLDGTYINLSLPPRKYTVVKGDISFVREGGNIMYQNCFNDIVASSSTLGTQFNPTFDKAQGPALLTQNPDGKNRFKVRVVPTGPANSKFSLLCRSVLNGQVVAQTTQEYKVIPPPPPDLLVLVDGRPWLDGKPIKATQGVAVSAVPEKGFAADLPQEARYQLIGVSLVRQLDGPETPISAPTNSGVGNARQPPIANIGGINRQTAAGGGTFKIKVQGVVRHPASGGAPVQEPVLTKVITIPLRP